MPESIVGTLVNDIGVGEKELERRKAWLCLTAKDEKMLTELNEVAKGYADEVIEELYDHFMKFDESKAFFGSPKTLDRVKALQKQYFLRLTEGNYDMRYIEDRLKIGAVHERIGLDVKWYLGS